MQQIQKQQQQSKNIRKSTYDKNKSNWAKNIPSQLRAEINFVLNPRNLPHRINPRNRLRVNIPSATNNYGVKKEHGIDAKFAPQCLNKVRKVLRNILLRKSMRNLTFLSQPAKMSGEFRRLPSDFLRLRNKNVAFSTVKNMGNAA